MYKAAYGRNATGALSIQITTLIGPTGSFRNEWLILNPDFQLSVPLTVHVVDSVI